MLVWLSTLRDARFGSPPYVMLVWLSALRDARLAFHPGWYSFWSQPCLTDRPRPSWCWGYGGHPHGGPVDHYAPEAERGALTTCERTGSL